MTDALLAFVKARIPFRPTAWRQTRHDPWTLGYGHTEGVVEGDTITMADAEAQLRADLEAVL